MRNKPHTIGKQLFEAEYYSDSNGLVFRQEFTQLVERSLLSVLEEVLDELDSKDFTLRLEKIEIELNQVVYPFNELNIKNQFRKCLRDELNFKIVAVRHQKKYVNQSKDQILVITKTEEELLLYFFRYGLLPWWHSESKSYPVWVEELIEKLARADPGAIIRILKKIVNYKEQVKRFVYHCPESSLFLCITSIGNISWMVLEEFKSSLYQIVIEKHIHQFDIVFKEFLVSYFVLKRKKINSVIDLRAEMANYVLQQELISKFRVIELFPEYFISSWLKFYFPEYFLRFHQYVKSNPDIYDRVNKENLSRILKKLLTYLISGKNENLTKIKDGLLFTNQDVFKEVGIMSDPFTEGSIKPVKKSKQYFEVLEEKILQYLMYGIISWEDRITGVKGIEALIIKLHRENPDTIRSIVDKIEWKYYPIVLQRIERDFDSHTIDLFFNYYFKREVALKQSALIEYREQILKTFFEKGIPPWEEIIGNTSEYTESIILKFYQQDSGYFVKALKTFFKDNTEFMERVEASYSLEFITFLKTIIKKEMPELELNSKIVEAVNEIPSDVDLIIFYLTFFEKYKRIPSNVAFSLHDLVEYFITHFPEEAKRFFTVAVFQNYSVLDQNFSTDIVSTINKWTKPFGKGRGEMIEKSQRNKIAAFKVEEPPELNEAIYIVNAGLVLIHPFLQRFFSLGGLLEKRNFKDEEAKHKAVHLLQYIVSRAERTEEHALVLNKIVCGIPLTEPIDRTIELTEEDKEICESLIRGVIENWPILKKTSNENFRVSLLQREGRLKKEERVWRLKVEERSYDVLLDKLPWNISMIKLPWMENMLAVEWR